MTSLNGFLFRRMELFLSNFNRFWTYFRSFFYDHKTLFDILFLMIYTLEQLTLFLLTLYFQRYSDKFAGVFALIFITTISFEKICMESRYRLLNESNATDQLENENIIKQYEFVLEENENLRRILEKRIK